jgi:rare lipoprotein A
MPVGQVRVANADVKGVRFYRVRVGPIADVATADKLLSKVVQMGKCDARIVVD